MPKRKPGQLRAQAYLRQVIENARRGDSPRLPSLSLLAARADVSRDTMYKAMGELKRDGVLIGRERSGVFVNLDNPLPATDSSTKQVRTSALSRMQIVERKFGADIDAGRFEGLARIPPVKVLAQRYASSPRMVAQALRSLANREIVRAHGRGYRLQTATIAPRLGTIVLVCGGDDRGRPIWWTARSQECMRLFEHECAVLEQSHITVTCHLPTGRLFEPGGSQTSVEALMRRPALLGFVVFSMATSAETLSALISAASRIDRPVALLEEYGGELGLRPAATSKFFTAASAATPGRAAGMFMRGLGHRRVAYISAMADMPWSEHRLAGLRETLSPSGDERAVSAVTDARSFELLGSKEYEAARREAAERFLRRPPRYEQQGHEVLVRLMRELRDEVGGVLTREAFRLVTRQLFERALNMRDVTAWVCDSDATAIDAMRFLAECGVDVPASVSVMGFDDSIEAFEAGLTSYNFGVPSLVKAMVQHVLAPRRADMPRTGLYTEIDGSITVRRSTAARSV